MKDLTEVELRRELTRTITEYEDAMSGLTSVRSFCLGAMLGILIGVAIALSL